jgi:putative transposase
MERMQYGGPWMRPSKFTEVQMMQALQNVKDGTPAVQECLTLGITQTTFYRWRNKFDGAALSELREVRKLRDENYQLKQIVANLLLEKQEAAVARGRR